MGTKSVLLALVLCSGPVACAGSQDRSQGNLEDDDAVDRVLWSYAHHFDSADLPAWLDLFADDIHWKVFVGDRVDVELQGRRALEQHWLERRSWSPSDTVTGRHVIANRAILERSDTTIKLRAYALVIAVAGKRRGTIVTTGHYQGDLVREGGQWRIRQWIVTIDSNQQ